MVLYIKIFGTENFGRNLVNCKNLQVLFTYIYNEACDNTMCVAEHEHEASHYINVCELLLTKIKNLKSEATKIKKQGTLKILTLR